MKKKMKMSKLPTLSGTGPACSCRKPAAINNIVLSMGGDVSCANPRLPHRTWNPDADRAEDDPATVRDRLPEDDPTTVRHRLPEDDSTTVRHRLPEDDPTTVRHRLPEDDSTTVRHRLLEDDPTTVRLPEDRHQLLHTQHRLPYIHEQLLSSAAARQPRGGMAGEKYRLALRDHSGQTVSGSYLKFEDTLPQRIPFAGAMGTTRWLLYAMVSSGSLPANTA